MTERELKPDVKHKESSTKQSNTLILTYDVPYFSNTVLCGLSSQACKLCLCGTHPLRWRTHPGWYKVPYITAECQINATEYKVNECCSGLKQFNLHHV